MGYDILYLYPICSKREKMNKKQELLEIPFQPENDEQLEFQIIDMQKIFSMDTPCTQFEQYHRIKFNSIIIIMESEGEHNIDFKSYAYKKGTVLFIAKNQVTSIKVNPNLKAYIVEFTEDFLCAVVKESISDMFDYMRYSPSIQLDDETLESITNNINLLNHQLSQPTDEYKKSIIQSLFQSLLIQLKRERVKNIISMKSKDEKLYNQFIYEVRRNHKYTLRVEDYARVLDISSKTLSRILNRYTSRTTKAYLDEYLLIKIKRYLLDEGLTLQEIANRLEFDEVTNLIKFFKKFENLTPSEFKKKQQK